MLVAEKAVTTKVLNVTKFNNHLLLTTENGQIMLEVCTPSVIRIAYTLKEKIEYRKGIAFIDNNQLFNWSYEENSEYIILKTDELFLKVLKTTGALSYYDKNNKCLLKERANNSKELIPFELSKTIVDENNEVRRIETPDGIKEVLVDSQRVFDKISYHSRVNFEFTDEAIYGSGQQEEGKLNIRGTRVYLHQSNLKISIPMFISTNGYGLLFDNYSPLIFNDNEYGSYIYGEASQQLDYYFMAGNFDEIIGSYRELTGKTPMLPLWSFGFIQSLERYKSADELINTIKEYRKRKVPIDCIVLDWHSWEGEFWGQKTFDKTRFNNPRDMIDKLHELDSKLMISIWPNMRRGCDNYEEMKKQELMLPNSEIYDAYNEAGRKLYWEQTFKGLYQYGIDAWWCDSSEPFTPEWNEKIKPEPDQNYIKFRDSASIYVDQEVSNAYALYHAKGIYEEQRKLNDGKRIVNLTRSGYIGQQKYGTILWSGDISATWDTLRKQIVAGLNMSASGIPYWTLDIGAFFTKQGKPWFWNGDYDAGNKDLGYRELYTRWYQFGTFLPIFRSHGTDTEREIWRFGEKGDMFYDVIEQFTKLRYKLIPYIYSLAGQVHFKNTTIMRLLAFDFCHDENVYNIKDQYMFGRNIMVCPIFEAMYYNANSKKIIASRKDRVTYLPSENNWYDFWTDELHTGGKEIISSAPINIIPIYVKYGSIIPTYKEVQSTNEIDNKDFDITIYTGCDGDFNLYLDEGDNYKYESGEYVFINLNWADKENKLKISNCQNTYNSMPTNINFNINFVGSNLKSTKVQYNFEELEVLCV
ncbi:MAG: TIM-barrel domain-containing protein [Lachnospirales bacterium]